MRPRYAARYRQPQSDSTGIAVARLFQPLKRLENTLDFGLRYSLAFILDDDVDHVGPHLQCDGGPLSIFDGIVDEIGEASFEGDRTSIAHDARQGTGRIETGVRKIIAYRFDQRDEIDPFLRFIAELMTCEIDDGLNDGFDFRQI